MNVGEYDAMLGRSYAEIAAESRSQHRSQAFGSLQPKGVRFTQVRREASRVNEAQAAETERSLFDGIDTTWARFKPPLIPASRSAQFDAVRVQVARAQAAQYLRDPSAAIEPLTDIVRTISGGYSQQVLATLAMHPRSSSRVGYTPDGDAALDILERRASRALEIATGVAVEAEVERPLVGTADSAALTLTVYNRGRVPQRVTPAGLRRAAASWVPCAPS